MKEFQDLTGRRFGRLTATSYYKIPRTRNDKPNGSRVYYRCDCECGNNRDVEAATLKEGRQVSCGCFSNERRKKHGMHKTREYQTWADMVARCTNPAHACFRRYGGRGITVHPAWVESFEAFIADVGLRPSPGHSLDRIDNDGGYEPGNVRWATKDEQSNNKSVCRYLTHGDTTLTVTQWAKRLGVSPERLFHRLRKGWPVEEVLFLPTQNSWSHRDS